MKRLFIFLVEQMNGGVNRLADFDDKFSGFSGFMFTDLLRMKQRILDCDCFEVRITYSKESLDCGS